MICTQSSLGEATQKRMMQAEWIRAMAAIWTWMMYSGHDVFMDGRCEPQMYAKLRQASHECGPNCKKTLQSFQLGGVTICTDWIHTETWLNPHWNLIESTLKSTCFTDLSWFLEIVIIVPEHVSLFLFSCHAYSVPFITMSRKYIYIWIGYGPLTVTVVNEGL